MMLRTILAFTIMSLAAVPETFAQTDQTKKLEVRIQTLEKEVVSLTRQLAALNARIAAMEAGDKRTPAENGEMEAIYKSLKITKARIVGGPFTAGDMVTVSYELTNSSDAELRIPVDKSFTRPFTLVGSRQCWVERQGDDSTIPGIPPQTARQGSKYAAGGSIIPTKATIAAGESLPFQERVSTKGYPAGKYTFYIEYKKIREGIVQTEAVDFEVKDK